MGNNQLFKKALVSASKAWIITTNREHRRIGITVKDNCVNNVHD